MTLCRATSVNSWVKDIGRECSINLCDISKRHKGILVGTLYSLFIASLCQVSLASVTVSSFPCSPNVTFCGYSVPHPSERKINFRIQTNGESRGMGRGEEGPRVKETL